MSRSGGRGRVEVSVEGLVSPLKLLGGSWVVISRVISPLMWVISIATLFVSLLITTPEAPSRAPSNQPASRGVGKFMKLKKTKLQDWLLATMITFATATRIKASSLSIHIVAMRNPENPGMLLPFVTQRPLFMPLWNSTPKDHP